jgi:hypothetical protein
LKLLLSDFFSKPYLGLDIDPERQITVTCGSTEAMAAVMLATLNPGDEVIVFEPYYENYGPDAILASATPRYLSLHPPEWTFDEAELRQAFNEHTKAIIINTPHNPTGKVFTCEELNLIAELCQKWDVLVFTDEIYEHILYDETQHIAMATLPGMAERTVTMMALRVMPSNSGAEKPRAWAIVYSRPMVVQIWIGSFVQRAIAMPASRIHLCIIFRIPERLICKLIETFFDKILIID